MLDVALTVNGTEHRVTVEARRTLADVIREKCGLTGTHLGCEHGASTVLVDGQPARSCLLLAAQVQGTHVTTIEGLAGPGGSQAREEDLTVSIAVDADGTLRAMSVDLILDQGAYPAFPVGAAMITRMMKVMFPGSYRWDAFRIR